MENIEKDTLGIALMKLTLKDIVNLRLTCKKLNEKIQKYNKYWFSLYFKKNMFKVLKEANNLPKHTKTFKGFNNLAKLEIPYLSCMTDREGDDVQQSMVNHYNFNKNFQEAENLGYFSKDFKMAYCTYCYLKETEPNFICKDISHYEYFPSYFFYMKDVNILNTSISTFYKCEVNYFRDLFKNL